MHEGARWCNFKNFTFLSAQSVPVKLNGHNLLHVLWGCVVWSHSVPAEVGNVPSVIGWKYNSKSANVVVPLTYTRLREISARKKLAKWNVNNKSSITLQARSTHHLNHLRLMLQSSHSTLSSTYSSFLSFVAQPSTTAKHKLVDMHLNYQRTSPKRDVAHC